MSRFGTPKIHIGGGSPLSHVGTSVAPRAGLTMRLPRNLLGLSLLPTLLFACGSSGSGSEPAPNKEAGVVPPQADGGSVQGFQPPCADANACPPFTLAENGFLPFAIQATGEGFASLSVNGIEEWTYATNANRTLWTFPEGTRPRAFSVTKTNIVVAFEDGSVWRARRDGQGARQVVTGHAKVMQIVANGEDFYWVSAGGNELVKLGADDATKVVADKACSGLGLAIAGDQAYVLSDACRGILSFPLAGAAASEPKVFWQDLVGGKPAYVTTDGKSLAWINLMSRDAGLNLSDLASGQTRLLAAFRDMPADVPEGNTSGVAVALDDKRVYLATRVAFANTDESGRVYAIDRQSGGRVELSDQATNVKDVAVDDRLVVWAHWSTTSHGLRAKMK